MVNAQGWLESQEEYNTKEKRKKATKLQIWSKKLEGDLDLREFSQLEKLDCSNNKITSLNISKCSKLREMDCSNNNLRKLDLNNCQELTILNCINNRFISLDLEGCKGLVRLECCRDQLKSQILDLSKFPKLSKHNIFWTFQAQEWLNDSYPKESRSLIKNLYISNKNLEGSLNLKDFCNLEKLDCSYNQLVNLNLTGLARLEKINCDNNFLISFDYHSLNPKKLTWLSMLSNNLPKQDLSCFKHLTNLEYLWVGNYDRERIKKSVYNRFCGSPKCLDGLTKLERLQIQNTDVENADDVYLPASSKRENKDDWRNIHPTFNWQKQGEWERLGFDRRETEKWVKIGLQPDDYHFAAWLRWKNYNPQKNLNWEALRKQDRSVQKWLDEEYSNQERKNWVTWLEFSRRGLGGDLTIENFTNLEKIDCFKNQLSSVTLNNLPKLTHFDASSNKLVNFTISDCPKITHLRVHDNFLTSLDFLSSLNNVELVRLHLDNNNFPSQDINIFDKFRNLEILRITNNRFCGSAQSLRNLNKLVSLAVANTDIKEGFEYLPKSLVEIASVYSQELVKSDDSFKLKWTDKVKVGVSQYHNVPYYDFKYWKESQPYFQWLKKEIEKLNPNLDIYDFLKNVFFNVRTGEFVGNFQAMKSLLEINKAIIEEKKLRISFLELQIQELTNLIKNQKEKIVNAYLYFASEKELLGELIKAHLEFTKLKKQKSDSNDYGDQCEEYEEKCQEIKRKLRKKLTKEEKGEMERILSDCEELVTWELEIKLSTKMLFLEETKIPKITITGTVHGSVLIGPLQINGDADFSCNKQITYQPIIDEQLIKELIAELIEIKKNIKQKNNQIETDSKKQIQNFLTIKQFTPKDKEILEKTINFLDAKKIFLNLRQGTIDSLQACCNKFEQAHTTGKYAIIDDVSDIITSVGEITDPLITTSISVSPVKAVGGIMKGVNNLFKNKSLSNNSKKIQEVLVTDKRSIFVFDEYYTALTNDIWNHEENEISKIVIDIFDLKKNKTSLFSEHDVFNILNIWKGKSVITLDEMKDSIEKLNSDLKEFTAKLESEENQFQQRIFTKFEESNNQRHQTQIEIPPKS